MPIPIYYTYCIFRDIQSSLFYVQGDKRTTSYRWDFNDSSDPVVLQGFDTGHIQTHSFARPGVYNVTLLATNNGGSAERSVTVTVFGVCVCVCVCVCVHLHKSIRTITVHYVQVCRRVCIVLTCIHSLPTDRITNVDIVYPIQYSQVNHSVPTDIYLVFTSSIVTQFNTNYTGDVLYTWDFGDGTGPVSIPSTTVTHSYNESGLFSLTLSVRTQIISSSAITTAQINVFNCEQ